MFDEHFDDIKSVDTVSVNIDKRSDIDTFIQERLKGRINGKSIFTDYRYAIRYRNGLKTAAVTRYPVS